MNIQITTNVRHWLLLMVCLFSSLPSWADDYTKDGIIYSIDETAGTASVKGVESKSITTANIESSVKGCKVTRIEDSAFGYCSSMTSINIPNTITYIGWHSFDRCSSLESLYIPTSVTTISGDAFLGCHSIKSFSVSASNPNYSSQDMLLMNKSKTHLIFALGNLASYSIPNTVTIVEDNAFLSHQGLVFVDIPQTVTSIGNGAFAYCSSLVHIDLPNAITRISKDMFNGCSSLTSISIPRSVTSIENYAFTNCSSLKTIEFNSDTPPSIGYAFAGTDLDTIIVPNNTADAYKNAYSWSSDVNFVTETTPYNIIKDGIVYSLDDVTNTAYVIRPENKDIVSAVISDNVNGHKVISINDNAFKSCSSLVSVTLPNSITNIGQNAFYQCSSLASITIPSSVTQIGSLAFYNCRSLTSVAIPSSITSINWGLFWNCLSLTSVTIPNSVTSIGYAAFESCTSLPSIEIPNSVTNIGEYAFENCHSLTSVAIPSSVTNIGECTFRTCKSLKTIRFEGIEPPVIGSEVFDYTAVQNVIVPSEAILAYKKAYNFGSDVNITDEISYDLALYNKVLALATTDYSSQILSYTANDGLITDASQLATNAQEPTEGSLAALIDNDTDTFFHSTWSQASPTDDYHYLQVDLKDAYKQIALKYTKRQGSSYLGGGNGNPTTLHVYVTNTPNDENSWTDLGTKACTYEYDNSQTGMLPIDFGGKAYRHIRLVVEATILNSKENGNLFFYWSELHAYTRACKTDLLDDATCTTLKSALAEAAKALDEGIKANDVFDVLQIAYDNAQDALKTSYIVDLDFAKSSYITAYSDKALIVPTGVKAGIVVDNGRGGIRTDYRYEAGDAIPANTGVLLSSGKGNSFYLTATETTETAPEDNLLHGTLNDETTNVEGANKYYKLSYDKATGTKIGFYWGTKNGGAFVNKAGKAFLALPSTMNAAQLAGFSLFDLNNNQAITGISSTEATNNADELKVYDLNGRRINVSTVDELPQGIYIINGKKIIK